MLIRCSSYRTIPQFVQTLRSPSIIKAARSMSSSNTPTKHEWIVILPDHAGALEHRMKVRQYVSSTINQHLLQR